MMGNGSLAVIDVEHLIKSYARVRAVDDLSFSVTTGEVFGLLGSNGAGKSTTLAVIQGLRRADHGRVTVFGMDVRTSAPQIKQRMGVQLQRTSLLPDLTVLEQVQLFARLHSRALSPAEGVAQLQTVGLAGKAAALPANLSGGQQKRLAVALALVGDPDILLLDEPTAGLDPQSRHVVWDLVRNRRERGCTIVLCTHAMEEAEILCDRVAIMDRGKLLDLGTPRALVSRSEGPSWISTASPLPIDRLRSVPGVEDVRQDGAVLRVRTNDVAVSLRGLLEVARSQNVSLADLMVKQPSLEDTFLRLTGREIHDE